MKALVQVKRIIGPQKEMRMMKQVMKAVVAMAVCMLATAEDLTKAPDLMPVTLRTAPKHKPVELVRKGKAKAVVYVAPRPRKTLQKRRVRPRDVMVKELLKAVKLTSGAELAIVTEVPAADQPAIIIGDCEASRKAGIDTSKIPVDGFEIKTAANRIFLVGSTMKVDIIHNRSEDYANDGTSAAISDFLERFVGVRWFWPLAYGGRSVIKQRDIIVAPVNYTDAPVFAKRYHYPRDYVAWDSTCNQKLQKLMDPKMPQPPAPEAWKDAPKKMDLVPMLVALREGHNWPYQIKVHTPAQFKQYDKEPLVKMRSLVKDAPWWVWQNEGCTTNLVRSKHVLCYSSQEAIDHLIAGCEGTWDKGEYNSPWVTSHYLSISPGDEPLGCHCAECLKHADLDSPQISAASGHYSKPIALGVKKMCEIVEKRWPEKRVLYLPYWNYTLCPEDVDYPDNLELEVCTTATARYNEKSTRELLEKNLRAWSKKIDGRKLTTWEYSGWATYSTHAPMQYPHLIADYYRKNREMLAGSMINGGNSPEWHRNAPTQYVWMRVMWNPDINVDAQLDALCNRQFGKGAKTARALLQLMCDRWEGIETTHIMFPDWGKLDDKIFLEHYPTEVVDQMEKLYRQARKEMKGDPESLARFDFWNYTFEAFLKEARTVRPAKSE
jgi:hypothetical protein